MFEKLAEDIYMATMYKLACYVEEMEKTAAPYPNDQDNRYGGNNSYVSRLQDLRNRTRQAFQNIYNKPQNTPQFKPMQPAMSAPKPVQQARPQARPRPRPRPQAKPQQRPIQQPRPSTLQEPAPQMGMQRAGVGMPNLAPQNPQVQSPMSAPQGNFSNQISNPLVNALAQNGPITNPAAITNPTQRQSTFNEPALQMNMQRANVGMPDMSPSEPQNPMQGQSPAQGQGSGLPEFANQYLNRAFPNVVTDAGPFFNRLTSMANARGGRLSGNDSQEPRIADNTNYNSPRISDNSNYNNSRVSDVISSSRPMAENPQADIASGWSNLKDSVSGLGDLWGTIANNYDNSLPLSDVPNLIDNVGDLTRGYVGDIRNSIGDIANGVGGYLGNMANRMSSPVQQPRMMDNQNYNAPREGTQPQPLGGMGQELPDQSLYSRVKQSLGDIKDSAVQNRVVNDIMQRLSTYNPNESPQVNEPMLANQGKLDAPMPQGDMNLAPEDNAQPAPQQESLPNSNFVDAVPMNSDVAMA